MPENPERHSDDPAGGSPVAGGAGESEEATGAGSPAVEPAPESAWETVGADSLAGESALPAGDDAPGDSGAEESDGDPAKTRAEISDERRAAAGKRVPIDDIRRALKEANGNRTLAARALGLNRKSVTARIASDPELCVIWGTQEEKQALKPPSETVTMMRSRESTQLVVGDQAIVGVIRETEKLIHEGLQNVGVPKDTIDTLRKLHGVAVTGGEFLAQSVWDIQDLYSIELYKIPSRLEWIRTKYLENEELPVMERMFWQRAYNELLEIMGKGKDRMIAGAEAISAMLKASQDGKSVSGVKKPGWGPRNSGG